MNTFFSIFDNHQIPKWNQSDSNTFCNTSIFILILILPTLCIWRARLSCAKRLSHCTGINFFNKSNNCNLRVFVVLAAPFMVATALLKYHCIYSITIYNKSSFPGGRNSTTISISAFFSHYCALNNFPAIKTADESSTYLGVLLSSQLCCYSNGLLLQLILFYFLLILTIQALYFYNNYNYRFLVLGVTNCGELESGEVGKLKRSQGYCCYNNHYQENGLKRRKAALTSSFANRSLPVPFSALLPRLLPFTFQTPKSVNVSSSFSFIGNSPNSTSTSNCNPRGTCSFVRPGPPRALSTCAVTDVQICRSADDCLTNYIIIVNKADFSAFFNFCIVKVSLHVTPPGLQINQGPIRSCTLSYDSNNCTYTYTYTYTILSTLLTKAYSLWQQSTAQKAGILPHLDRSATHSPPRLSPVSTDYVTLDRPKVCDISSSLVDGEEATVNCTQSDIDVTTSGASRAGARGDSGLCEKWLSRKKSRSSRCLTTTLSTTWTLSIFLPKTTTAQEVFGSGDERLRFVKHERINLTCLYKNFEDPLKVIWKWESIPKSDQQTPFFPSSAGGRPSNSHLSSPTRRPKPVLFYQTRTLPDGTKTVTDRNDQVVLDLNTVLEFDANCDSTRQACPAHLNVLDVAPHYSGYYSCEVSDMRGSAATGYTVDILEQAPPEDVQLKMITATATYYPGGSRSTQVITSGQELTLECSSDGFPSPMIKFLLNGNDIELGRVRLTDDQRTSQGKYLRRTIKIKDIDVKKPHLNWQCQANNAKGYDVSDQMEVTYKYKPTIITQSLQVEKRVLINTEVSIMCEVKDGNPPETRVYWVQGSNGNGNHVSNSAQLHWSASVVDAEKTGDYTCVAMNDVDKDTFTIRIIVEYPPVVNISPEVQSVEQGQDVNLVCNIDAEPQAVQVQWRHDTLANIQGTDNVLLLENVTRAHEGKYTCTVKNEHGSASKSATITVNYQPILNFSIMPKRTEFLEGDSVKITCSAQSKPKPDDLSIIKKDAPTISESTETRAENHLRSYEIASLTREHSGTYQCSAKNTVGRTTEKIDISVQYGPIIAPMTPQRIDEGQTLRVRCDVQSNPPAKISWYTPDKNMYMTGPDLVLQAVTQSDAGIYVCQAKTTFYNQNQVTDTREVQVFVKFPPQYLPCSPRNMEGLFSALPGQSAKLCCQFVLYQTDKPNQVRWYKESRGNKDEISQSLVKTTNVQNDSPYQLKLKSELRIPQVSTKDFGNYFCAVRNDKGEQFNQINLKTLKIPGEPAIRDVLVQDDAALKVNWDPVSYMSDDKSWYEVGYRPTGKTGNYKTTKVSNSNEFVLGGLEPGQKYDVSVKACNTVGCSQFPEPYQMSTPTRQVGGQGNGATDNNVPIRTIVIIPLILVGLVLLVSLLVVMCRRSRDRSRNNAFKKGIIKRPASPQLICNESVVLINSRHEGIPAHPEELEELKRSQSSTLSAHVTLSEDPATVGMTQDYTYVDYSLGPPGSSAYQILSPHHGAVGLAVATGTGVGSSSSKSSSPPIHTTGIPISPSPPGVLGGPGAGGTGGVINLSTSLDKASFNKLRGEPEGKERVRFADADGNTHYPGEVDTKVTHAVISNGKLPQQQNGGPPNHMPIVTSAMVVGAPGPRYNTLPHKLQQSTGSGGGMEGVTSVDLLTDSPDCGGGGLSDFVGPPGLAGSAGGVQDHIYSTTSRAKPAPLPRAPSTNLSHSQAPGSSSTSASSGLNKSPPPPNLPPSSVNGPILKKSSNRSNTDSISPPVSIEGDHKTLTLKCASGYSITSV